MAVGEAAEPTHRSPEPSAPGPRGRRRRRRDAATPRPGRRLGAPRPEGLTPFQSAPYGWAPVVIMVAVSIVDRIESSITGGILPLLQEEFGISDTVGGAIPTAVIVAGAVATLPAGYLADRYNRSNLISLVVLSWTVLLVGTALATSFVVFFAMRILLGAADSIDNPAASSLLADSYPPLARAKVLGYARLTTYVGGSLGTMYGAVVGDTLGWRWAFALIIAPGLVVAWLCWRLREPARGFIDAIAARGETEPVPAPASPDDTPVGVAAKLSEVLAGTHRTLRRSGAVAVAIAVVAVVLLGVGAGLAVGRAAGIGALAAVPTTAAALWASYRLRHRLRRALDTTPLAPSGPSSDDDFRAQLRTVARIRTLRSITIGLAAMTFGLGGLLYWTPTLLYRDFGLSVAEGGTLSAGVTVVGLVGGVAYGGRLGRLWHGTRPGGRLLAGGGGLLVGALLLLAALAQPTVLRFAALLLASTFFASIAVPNLNSAIADVVMSHVRGIGFSLLNFVIAASAAGGPLAVGVLSDRTGSLSLAMYTLGVPSALSALVVLSARRTYDADAQYVLDEAWRRHGGGPPRDVEDPSGG